MLGPLTAAADGDDWYVDVTTPAPGAYTVEATAVAHGATEKLRTELVVEA